MKRALYGAAALVLGAAALASGQAFSTAKRGEGTVAGSFADSLQLGLPPGPYTWSVALQDVATGLSSYLVVRKVL